MPNTVSDDMVERVGAAIESAWNAADLKALNLPPIDLTAEERNHLARAAIAAMREPTERMGHEGFHAAWSDVDCDCGGELRIQTTVGKTTWRTMIDAALSEPTEAAS